ncbi:MAG: fibronectin [Fidelibacterota bacterium]|nr:MAG: fibronectin [Candidatus Neomarinimicrobiota bacterium]
MKSKHRHTGLFLIYALLIMPFFLPSVKGDDIKWIAIGDLHNWFSSAGGEREVGRRGEVGDQQDGLRWPAQYDNQDVQAAKAMWIGATNFYDANIGKTYEYKVVHVGPRVLDDISEIMPVKPRTEGFVLYGQYAHPSVFVDGNPGSNTMFGMDDVDEVDESLPADRMIYNELNTALGVTLTRRIYAFTNQYHQNYHIFDYVFENTGIITNQGDVQTQTLEGLVIFFQYRYAPTREACIYEGNYLPQSATWGHNVVNDAVFTHPETSDPFRAQFAWMGLHSKANFNTIGGAHSLGDGHLGASQYVGVITLHADTSPSDPTDNPAQPFTTMYLQSDHEITSGNNQFNDVLMRKEYNYMISGHPTNRHGEDMDCPTPIDCNADADQYVKAGDPGNPGGYSHGQGFGPYTLAPGESVHIVLAEGVAGISREMCYEIGKNWKDDAKPFTLPPKAGRTFTGSGPTDDKDFYKNVWVYTGEDSLFQTFERAVDNYSRDFDIPQPPRPPELFEVQSGGDRISLSWSYSGGVPASVAGFEVYRAVHQPDTSYNLIFSGDAGITSYDDMAAVRGVDYYYYLVALDDGSTNDIHPGIPLVSSKFWTMTNAPASLRRPPGSSMAGIRIVPNPYNIKAQKLQFGESERDRIMFYNLPPFCVIKIFTERGDLVQTIEHTDGSGDEGWDSVTSSRQTIVSGLYIAYFEVSEDAPPDPITGAILFRKGQTEIKKFIVIR